MCGSGAVEAARPSSGKVDVIPPRPRSKKNYAIMPLPPLLAWSAGADLSQKGDNILWSDDPAPTLLQRLGSVARFVERWPADAVCECGVEVFACVAERVRRGGTPRLMNARAIRGFYQCRWVVGTCDSSLCATWNRCPMFVHARATRMSRSNETTSSSLAEHQRFARTCDCAVMRPGNNVLPKPKDRLASFEALALPLARERAGRQDHFVRHFSSCQLRELILIHYLNALFSIASRPATRWHRVQEVVPTYLAS